MEISKFFQQESERQTIVHARLTKCSISFAGEKCKVYLIECIPRYENVHKGKKISSKAPISQAGLSLYLRRGTRRVKSAKLSKHALAVWP